MTDQNSPKTPARRVRWFLDRAVDIAAACVILSIIVFALGSAVFIVGFVLFEGKDSALAAAWFQAIGAPLAIGGALWAAWYQAERAHRSAREILDEQRREQAESRIRKARRELLSAHAALSVAAIMMNANIRQVEQDPKVMLDAERTIHLDVIVARLRFFESPGLEAGIDVVTTSLVAQLDGLSSRMRHAVTSDEPVAVLKPYLAQVARAVLGASHTVERMFTELGAEVSSSDSPGSFSVRRPVSEWKFIYDWEQFFKRWEIERMQTVSPKREAAEDLDSQWSKAP